MSIGVHPSRATYAPYGGGAGSSSSQMRRMPRSTHSAHRLPLQHTRGRPDASARGSACEGARKRAQAPVLRMTPLNPVAVASVEAQDEPAGAAE